MVKFCSKCRKELDENKDKLCMIIGKKDGKIFEFECFHYECWKSFFAKAVMTKVGEVFENKNSK